MDWFPGLAAGLPVLFGAAAPVAGIALAVLALRRGRATAGEVVGGLRNGAIIAAIVLLGVATAVTSLTVGRPFLFGATMTLEGALTLGLAVGLVVGAGYLVVGALVMLVGLNLRHSASWSRREAWLVTPMIGLLGAAALGFALGLGEYADRPTTRAGTLELSLHGAELGQIEVAGQARCTFDDGNLAVSAGADDGSELTTAEGVPLLVQLGLLEDGQPRLDVSVGDRQAADARSPTAQLRLDEGSNRYSGGLRFDGLASLDRGSGEPRPSVAWSGRVAWRCSF